MLGPFVETARLPGRRSCPSCWGSSTCSSSSCSSPSPVLYGIFLSVAAVLLEEISFRRYPGWVDLTKLLVFGVLENFGYRQLLALLRCKAFWDVIRRRRTWGHMERSGFGEPLPAPAADR